MLYIYCYIHLFFFRREQLHLLSVYSCWNSLVNQTRKDARDHAAMADVYLNNIIPRFTQVQDDVQRIYKRVRNGYKCFFWGGGGTAEFHTPHFQSCCLFLLYLHHTVLAELIYIFDVVSNPN